MRISDWSSDVCSSDLSNDRRTSCSHAWMKPAQEMIRLFEDLPEAIRNTLVVAQRCAVAAPKRKPILPSLAGDREAEARMLAEEARAGLARRLDAASIPEHERGPYQERLAFGIDETGRASCRESGGQ